MPQRFMPRSPYAPRHTTYFSSQYARKLRSTKLLRASTSRIVDDMLLFLISIHEALASLDAFHAKISSSCLLFRSTRLLRASTPSRKRICFGVVFRSTRLLRASTFFTLDIGIKLRFRSTRLSEPVEDAYLISIHEALAT